MLSHEYEGTRIWVVMGEWECGKMGNRGNKVWRYRGNKDVNEVEGLAPSILFRSRGRKTPGYEKLSRISLIPPIPLSRLPLPHQFLHLFLQMPDPFQVVVVDNRG